MTGCWALILHNQRHYIANGLITTQSATSPCTEDNCCDILAFPFWLRWPQAQGWLLVSRHTERGQRLLWLRRDHALSGSGELLQTQTEAQAIKFSFMPSDLLKQSPGLVAGPTTGPAPGSCVIIRSPPCTKHHVGFSPSNRHLPQPPLLSNPSRKQSYKCLFFSFFCTIKTILSH